MSVDIAIAQLIFLPKTHQDKPTPEPNMASKPGPEYGQISISEKESANKQQGVLNNQMNGNDMKTQIEFISLHRLWQLCKDAE